jgi:glycosyltransferase involved in cell wall biosynthesis
VNARPLRVYISGPAFHIRPKNTDWQYLRLLTRLPEFVPQLTICREAASWNTVAFNLRYAAHIAASRLGAKTRASSPPELTSTLPRADLRRSGSDLIYAYGECPVNAPPMPLVFHTGAIDAEQLRSSGLLAAEVAAFLARRRSLMNRATLLTANSQAALDNLAEIAPELRARMHVLPFFLPHLAAVDEASIHAKFAQAGPLRLLFVGREARRKGLPELLAAFETLSAKRPGALALTVVSSFSDGPVRLPSLPNLSHLPQLDREAVQREMRASHLLLMPSHFEGYGWAYLEAMAAGAIPVATDAPIQREILADGNAGVLTAPDPARLEADLLPLIDDRAAARELALRAWNRCRQNYLPESVAHRMFEVFNEAKALGPSGP